MFKAKAYTLKTRKRYNQVGKMNNLHDVFYCCRFLFYLPEIYTRNIMYKQLRQICSIVCSTVLHIFKIKFIILIMCVTKQLRNTEGLESIKSFIS